MPGVRVFGVRAAARALGVSPSTVTRDLKRWPDLNYGDAGRPLVSVAALRARRAVAVNAALSGNHAGETVEAPRGAEGVAPGLESVAPGLQSVAPTVAPAGRVVNPNAAYKGLQIQLLQVRLDREAGTVAPVRETVDAALAAGVGLRDRLAARRRALAERLAGLRDARAIELALEEGDAAVLEAVCDAFAGELGEARVRGSAGE